MKKWNRVWKIEWIEKSNPEWNDLFSEEIDDSLGAQTRAAGVVEGHA
jgi:hypothetical protein